MKVLMASQFFVKFTERLDFRLAMQLKRKGVETIMLFPSSANKTTIVNGLRVYCFKPKPIVRSISSGVLKGSYVLDMFQKSLSIVKKEKIDLLHAFFAIPPGLAMMLCKKFTARPLVLSVSGADVGIVEEITYGLRLDPLANKLINLALRSSDQIVVPSYRFKELAVLAGATEKRATIIPWGVDLEEFQQEGKKLNESTKTTSEERIITSLCRHTRVKGLNYLLHAMPRILQEYPNVKLVLAGLGKQTEKLKGVAKNLKIDQNVAFPGYVFGEEKRRLLAISDIFVQPSLSDGFAISVLEALANGKPVVITDKVGLSDFLKDGECGFIVESGNAEVLAEAILRLLSDDNLRLKLGKRARKKAEEFRWDKITKEIVEMYYKALA